MEPWVDYSALQLDKLVLEYEKNKDAGQNCEFIKQIMTDKYNKMNYTAKQLWLKKVPRLAELCEIVVDPVQITSTQFL